MIRKLKIDWAELEAAFETSMDGLIEIRYFLDLETGEVVMISSDAVGDYLEEPIDRDLPEWRLEAIQEARQIEQGYGTRYIRIPQAETHEDYRDMERFISTVSSSHLRDQLWRAIEGRGAFRYFKDVLYNNPDERERWFAFKNRCVYERIAQWLESEGIESTNLKEPPEMPESQDEDGESREALIEDLTLLLIYLSSWEEKVTSDLAVHRAWKGYLFEVLDELEEKGYISQTRRAKSLMLTEDGVAQARELEKYYTQ